MFKLIVKDLQNNILHEPTFASLEEAEAMKSDILVFNDWNFPSHLEVKPGWVEVIREENMPEYTIIHPEQIAKIPDFTIEILDITAEILAEQAQIDAVKAAQQQAGMRLMLFPQQVDDCHDLDSLKETMKLMVSDIAVLLVK
jgi:hypothetical protein